MRWIMPGLLTLVFWSPAQAQPVRIERVEILGVGEFALAKDVKTIKSKDISTGQRTVAEAELVKETTTITAKYGTSFGAKVRFVGKAGSSAKIKVVWRYPDPGIVNPQSGTAKFLDEFEDNRDMGTTASFTWNLQSDWVLVTGRWTLELWQGDRRLMSQDFTLVK